MEMKKSCQGNNTILLDRRARTNFPPSPSLPPLKESQQYSGKDIILIFYQMMHIKWTDYSEEY